MHRGQLFPSNTFILLQTKNENFSNVFQLLLLLLFPVIRDKSFFFRTACLNDMMKAHDQNATSFQIFFSFFPRYISKFIFQCKWRERMEGKKSSEFSNKKQTWENPFADYQ